MSKHAARGQGGFSTIELLVVMGIIALMASAYIGILLVGDEVQVARCKADIQTLQSVLEMYYEETGMYPVGGIVGMVRALSYPEGGWSGACLREHIRTDALIQAGGDGSQHYETIIVDRQQVERPILTLVDPWGNEYVYLGSMEYEDPPGHSSSGIDSFRYNPACMDNNNNTEKAKPARLSTGVVGERRYYNHRRYQIFSFGPDGLSDSPPVGDASRDNVNNWASL